SLQTVGGHPLRSPSMIALPDHASVPYSFSSPTIATTASYTILPTDTFIIIQRSNPTATALTLGRTTLRNPQGLQLAIADQSTGLTGDHTITLTPFAGETIMGQSTWQLVSNTTML